MARESNEMDLNTALEIFREGGISREDIFNGDTKKLHSAYRKLVKKYHPDLAGKESEEKFKDISIAYSVLKEKAEEDEKKRSHREFKENEKKIQRLKQLEEELKSLDTTGFENEVRSILSKIKDPDKVNQVEEEISELKKKIEKEERGGEIEDEGLKKKKIKELTKEKLKSRHKWFETSDLTKIVGIGIGVICGIFLILRVHIIFGLILLLVLGVVGYRIFGTEKISEEKAIELQERLLDSLEEIKKKMPSADPETRNKLVDETKKIEKILKKLKKYIRK